MKTYGMQNKFRARSRIHAVKFGRNLWLFLAASLLLYINWTHVFPASFTHTLRFCISSKTDCSGQGVLLFGKCFCDVGWQGSNCSVEWDEPAPECGRYNDKCFFHPEYGVAKVSYDRWKQAQKAENATWAQQRTSDRNYEHAENFEQYSALSQLGYLGDVIEYGCGPFTQSLTIFETTGLKPSTITLVDPLASIYMETVRACRYKNGSLGGYSTEIKPVSVEDFEVEKQYDTVISLNFIEHVKDAFQAYNKVFQSLKVGGIMIFHERFWPHFDGIEKVNPREFDLHPIRLTDAFGHWLATEFDLLFEHEQNEKWGNIGYYWIGRKRAVNMATIQETLKENLNYHNERLAKSGFSEHNIWGNIYNGQDLQQGREYMSYTRKPSVKTVCEVGFAGGHSAIVYKTAQPEVQIYSFDDFGKKELSEKAYEFVEPLGNIHIMKGDSTFTVPEFRKTKKNVLCDVISIDGAHHGHFPFTDIKSLKFLANHPNTVLIDDYHPEDWPAVYDAVEKHVKQGALKVSHVSKSSIVFRGKEKQWAVAEYTLLTIICATRSLDRFDNLKKLVQLARNHPVVQQVIIIWNGPNLPTEVEKLPSSTNGEAILTVVHYEKNSLNNRFDANLPIHTEAVMILDDDLEITNETINCAFNAWKKDKSPLYSFGAGRYVSKDTYSEKDMHGSQNFLLPRFIFHVRFLNVYSSPKYTNVRNYVDIQEGHCDDVAFSLIISKYTGKPIHYVPAQCKDRAMKGLAHTENRYELRKECSRDLIEMIGWELPQLETTPCFA